MKSVFTTIWFHCASLNCSRLIPLVDAGLGRVLEQITRDEERHIRWADIRLARILDEDERRACKQLMDRVGTMLDSVWPKPWLEIGRRRVVSMLTRR